MKAIYFLSLNAIQFVPYAYGLLRSYCQEIELIARNYEWKEPIWKIEPTEKTIKRIVDPDILCASCYVWNHNQQAHIAQEIKNKYPHCKIVFGGPHIPDSSQTYFSKHPHVDVLVHGEGEIPIKNLLIEWLNGSPNLSNVLDISYNESMRSINTPTGEKLPKDLSVPSPYLNGLFDTFFKDQHSNKIGLWESNRGCPHKCIFCDWGVRSTNKLKLHEFSKIRREIECLAEYKIKDLYVTDCNFGLHKRDLEIAEMLVESKRKYGYPKRVRIQFAKNSNQAIFTISKLLHENEMLWGTTLSMQSIDPNVLKAIDRQHLGVQHYKKLKDRYSKMGIPTYTELILGLPLETKESFIKGICTLFEIGIHEDIRVFELVLSPNAPMSHKSVRDRYGLKTKIKPLRKPLSNGVNEEVEVVFGTKDMPYEDWAYCLLFAESIQALHNGGYTRFLSIYLNDNKILSYDSFYNNLLTFFLKAESESSHPFRRIKRLIDDFYHDPHIPQIQRILAQPDMMELLKAYNPRRKGWQLWTYIWLSISENMNTFYKDLKAYLKALDFSSDKAIDDLFRYQQQIMLELDYDPKIGKLVDYKFNWFDYFFEKKAFKEESSRLRYTDKHMGITHRYALEKRNKEKFVNAAIGVSYPYTKFRHFFHQPKMTQKLHHQDNH